MAVLYDISEHRRLYQKAQRLRAEAIRIQIQAIHAFCKVVESKVRYGSQNDAATALAVARQRVAIIDFHLREPGHVATNSADELRSLLAPLEARIQHLEKSITKSGDKPSDR